MTEPMDKLRAILDEHGIEWRAWPDESSTTWNCHSDPHTAIEALDGTLQVTGLTPMQAVAATVDDGTCEWQLEHSGTLYDKWRCSKCGYLFVESRCDQGATELEPNFCPNCGRKVRP